MKDQGRPFLSSPRSTAKRLNPLSPNGTFDIFLSLKSHKEVGVTSRLKVKKPLQIILFIGKKEAEYSYATLNNSYKRAFKKVFSCCLFAFLRLPSSERSQEAFGSDFQCIVLISARKSRPVST